jgi:hypothetical protein
MGYVRVKLQLMRVTTMNISINDEKQHGVVEFSWLFNFESQPFRLFRHAEIALPPVQVMFAFQETDEAGAIH